jgi:predicted branched-subunit amino acid permease
VEAERPGPDAARGPGLRGTLITALPFALAIGTFGVVFGAAAGAAMDPLLVIAMSLLVFSGSLQFALVALVATGAGPAVLVLTAIVLNLRHVVFGALLRPHLDLAPWRRALLVFFMVDESFGLSLAAGKRAAAVLAISGVFFYIAWQVGTFLGLLGARAVALEEVAGSIFPVLFIGLAALTARGRDGMLRALAAAGIVVISAFVIPALTNYAPIIAAILVALPPRRHPPTTAQPSAAEDYPATVEF